MLSNYCAPNHSLCTDKMEQKRGWGRSSTEMNTNREALPLPMLLSLPNDYRHDYEPSIICDFALDFSLNSIVCDWEIQLTHFGGKKN